MYLLVAGGFNPARLSRGSSLKQLAKAKEMVDLNWWSERNATSWLRVKLSFHRTRVAKFKMAQSVRMLGQRNESGVFHQCGDCEFKSKSSWLSPWPYLGGPAESCLRFWVSPFTHRLSPTITNANPRNKHSGL